MRPTPLALALLALLHPAAAAAPRAARADAPAVAGAARSGAGEDVAAPRAVASGSSWRRPVPGAVARAFDYSRSAPFRAGAHRGVDLSAPPGAVVRAACSGTVATADGAVGAGVVTLRCGPWRVTALPLAAVAVSRGARVPAGAPIGRVGTMPAHTGLHVGVRRAGDRFAYVDPLPLLRGEPAPPVTAAPRSGPRFVAPRAGPAPAQAAPRAGLPRPAAPHAPPAPGRPRAAAPAAPRAGLPRPAAPHAPPAPGRPRAAAPAAPAAPGSPRAAAPAAPRGPRAVAPAAPGSPRAAGPVSPSAAAADSVGPAAESANLSGGGRGRVRVPEGGLAPWPAWVGLGLLAVGGVGGGVRIRARRARARAGVAVASAP
jgi:hypothetical protein